MNIWRSNAGSENDTLALENQSFRSQNQYLRNFGIKDFSAKINFSEKI